MTTAIIHGDPGSRKTVTLVAQYGIPALYEGRTVVSNIRGFTDLKQIEKVYGKKLPPEAKLISVPFTREGFKRMGNFFHWAPPGALILMDEGQRVYPTRMRDLKFYDCKPPRSTGFVDPATGQPEDIESVEEAFDCHRHMNWDIYISTPNIEKIHKEIRQVAEWGYRQKDMKSILPLLAFLLGEFKRVKHNAENKGFGEGQVISSSNHRVDKRAFKCYQSTSTGVAKETHTKTSIFSQPKLLCLIVLLGYGIWHFGSNFVAYGSPIPSTAQIAAADAKRAASSKPEPVAASAVPLAASGDRVQARDTTVPAVPERRSYTSLGSGVLDAIYSWTATVTRNGRTVHFFELRTDDGSSITVTSEDLDLIGVKVVARRNFVIAMHGENSKLVHTVYRSYRDPRDTMSTADMDVSPLAL